VLDTVSAPVAGRGGECAACRQEKADGLQAKLVVRTREGLFDRAADPAAEQVAGTTQGAHARLGPTPPPRISHRPAVDITLRAGRHGRGRGR
jgi:hypothetical protein